jgi:hypothetical protein
MIKNQTDTLSNKQNEKTFYVSWENLGVLVLMTRRMMAWDALNQKYLWNECIHLRILGSWFYQLLRLLLPDQTNLFRFHRYCLFLQNDLKLSKLYTANVDGELT